MTETAEIQCANLACKVKQDGKCVEGLATGECPHYGKPLAPSSPAAAALDDRHGIVMLSGDLLDQEEASQVLRRGASRVIAVVAPKDAGKTTLISSVHELLLRGPIGPLRFSGSRTLYAFERACHPSRGVSRNAVPKTERTLLTSVKFYHAALCRPGEAMLDIIVADRNGEDYGAAADDTNLVQDFVEIRRADTISFLIDGRQLIDPVTRNSVGSEMLAIAQALVDGGSIEGRPRAALVLTKLDDIERSALRERAEHDFARIEAKFRELHGDTFGEIRSFKVAACPSDMSLPLGHGVDGLVAYWEEAISEPLSQAPSYVPSPTRFMLRIQGSAE